jgi:hypothetical protein
MSGQGESSGSASDPPADAHLLQDIAQAVLTRHGGVGWSVEPREFWCMYTPPGQRRRDQGWKLHVSATLLSGPVVLARSAEVLIRARCAFKFARGFDELRMLLSGNCDRGSGGKFITAYPSDDDEFREVAAALDRVTKGLAGPDVLSDRRVRPGSPVSYRFGVFGARTVLTNDGRFESMLTGPDGQRQKDERLAWFSPPPWAVPPLPEPEDAIKPPAGRDQKPRPVLIGDRFVVREAIRQSYRGGVYRATDQDTAAEVVLKQARPHVMSTLSGEDARDGLRHEAANLERLADLGSTPRAVAMVTHQENLFLAEELVPGLSLRHWVTERVSADWRGRGAPLGTAVSLAGRLVDLLAGIHERDVVCRDFNPNNVMITPDEQVKLVDLEHMVSPGALVSRIHTPGYAAPEQTAAPPVGPAPDQTADVFSLGATLLFLASGVEPMLADDEPAARPVHDRLGELIARLGGRMPAVARLAPVLLALMRQDPAQRWDLSRARDFIARIDTRAPHTLPGDDRPASQDVDRLASPAVDRLVADGLRYLLRTRTPDAARLWPADAEFGEATDPANVQYGAAGVLAVLIRAAQVLGRDHLHDGVKEVADWVRRRRLDIERLLPGLYFGRAGTAWSLYDAARFLGDDEMARQAVDLAKRLPVEWPNPDICHGAAGAGFAQLHLWLATGDDELKARGVRALDCVLRAAAERDGRTVWPIPADFPSSLAGSIHYGFAHGVAGAGMFLLYGALATGRDEYLDAARRASETLLAVAEVEPDDGGPTAWWPSEEEEGNGGDRGRDRREDRGGDKARPRMRHWCSGSSGVGTFLIRLWTVTGERRCRDLAEAAAAAIRRDRWNSTISSCHGLSGDGDYLLDLAHFTGDRRYHKWAEELAAVMYARNTIRDGLMVLPDETGLRVTTGFGTGLGGAVAFLLRLGHGGPRFWMLDELLDDEIGARRSPDTAALTAAAGK